MTVVIEETGRWTETMPEPEQAFAYVAKAVVLLPLSCLNLISLTFDLSLCLNIFLFTCLL